jgi:plasmid stability protein
MARSITIRNVPDDVADELAARAASSGRSLQEYLRAQLESLASRPDTATWVAAVEARIEATGTRVTAKQILDARDADRR